MSNDSETPFDPHSKDAMFAMILAQLKTQDKDAERREVRMTTILTRIEDNATKTEGRVAALERDKWTQRGVVVGVATAISAGYELFKEFFRHH